MIREWRVTLLAVIAAAAPLARCQSRTGSGEEYLEVTENRKNLEGSWFTGSCTY